MDEGGERDVRRHKGGGRDGGKFTDVNEEWINLRRAGRLCLNVNVVRGPEDQYSAELMQTN